MAVFTHDFKLGFDGNVYKGEVEFDEDGIASYQFGKPYPMKVEQMELLNALIDLWHRVYHAFGEDINLIRLKKKGEEE